MATPEPRSSRQPSPASRGLSRAASLIAALAVGCGLLDGGADRLSKSEDNLDELPVGPPPPEDGPKLGAVAHQTPILERPTTKASALGKLHAGALVARSVEAVRTSRDCPSGYHAIFPRGYVCLNQGATLDLSHPTLVAMAIRPALDKPLPYAYARTTVETELFERDPNVEAGVRVIQKLAKGAGFAVVGSWSAQVGEQEPARLGLLMNGRFVRAEHLRAADASEFKGYELRSDSALPVGFVVKRQISTFKPGRAGRFEKDSSLDYHATVKLSGRHKVAGDKYWMTADKQRWVREQDITLVQRRTKFPEFAKAKQRWLDVSVVQGTLVAYEGRTPIYATLVSTGRDRLGAKAGRSTGNAAVSYDTDDADDLAVTRLGAFEVVSKSVSLLDVPPERAGERFPLYDIPWALELSSGQFVLGAYWHDRFGIEHGSGDILLSPSDAARLFAWATPTLPAGWHSASGNDERTIVHVHE